MEPLNRACLRSGGHTALQHTWSVSMGGTKRGMKAAGGGTDSPMATPLLQRGSGGTKHRFHQISGFVPPLVPPLLPGWAWTAVDGHGLQVVDSPKKKGVHWISVDALGWGYGGAGGN